MEEIRTQDIHLVDVYHSRYAVMLSLSPNCLGLRFNTTTSGHNCYRAVEYTQGALNFYSKVNVTGGVDDVDTVTLPRSCCSSRCDRDTTLLLLNHPVHCSGTFVNLTHLTVDTRVIEDSLSSRCLTRVDVSHDTDISCVFE